MVLHNTSEFNRWTIDDRPATSLLGKSTPLMAAPDADDLYNPAAASAPGMYAHMIAASCTGCVAKDDDDDIETVLTATDVVDCSNSGLGDSQSQQQPKEKSFVNESQSVLALTTNRYSRLETRQRYSRSVVVVVTV